MKRRLDLTPGFPAFLAAVWYFDSCGIFWPFLAAMTVHELAHAAVLLLLGGRIESVRLSFAQVELRTGLLSDRTELWSTAAGPGINLLCGWLFRRWMPAFAAVSLLLALFNLLPVWPLDGGRLLRTLLRMRWGAAGVDASASVRAWTAGRCCFCRAAMGCGRLAGGDGGGAARPASAQPVCGKSGCFSGGGTVK